MSEQRKAIIISTGMDNEGLNKGLTQSEFSVNASLQRQLTSFIKLSQQKAAIEAKENDASLARLKANLEKKAAATKAFFENQAAQAEIARGSIPENMQPGYAGGKRRGGKGGMTGGMTGGMIGSEVAADIGSGESAHDVVHGAAIFGESVAGGAIGNITGRFAIRMISKAFVEIAAAIGAAAGTLAAIIIGAVAAIAEFLPRIWGGATISGTWAAHSAAKASGLDLKQKQKDDAEMLRQRIEMMQKGGLISDSQARGLHAGLDGESQEGLIAAFNATNPLMNKLKSGQAHDYEMQAAHAGLTGGQSKYTFDLVQQHLLLEKIATLKKGSVAYEETLKKIQESWVTLEKDKVEMAADAAKKKKEDDEAALKAAKDLTAENQKRIDLTNELHRNERSQNEVLRQYQQEETMGIPSLEEAAAGGGFLTRLKNWYGRANKRGVQGMARDYVRQQYGMGYDFEKYALDNPGKNYGDWLKTDQGKGEHDYLQKLAGPLQALGIVKNDDLGGKLDDLNVMAANIHTKLDAIGIKSN